MSLVNACITRDQVLVVVDTMFQSTEPGQEGARYESSKLFPVVHSNLILTGRGSNNFLSAVLLTLLTMRATSFDDTAAGMQPMLRRMKTDIARAMQMAGRVGFVLGDQEVYLFGWSDAKKRMVGQAYFLDAESPDWEVLDMGETWATPWGDAWGDMPEPRSLAELQRVAETQVRLTRANAPEVAIGGRLIAAELSRAGITVRGVSDG